MRPAAPRDLFDLMSSARDPESGALFPPERLADQVATMIVAGHETTAVALFWSLYLWPGRPKSRSGSPPRSPRSISAPAMPPRSLPRLTYTRAVVHEALRLYPPAFTLARQALAADTAGGIPIAARTVVLIAPWVLHRHRLLWREPDTFDPSRFLPDAPPPGRFAYLPFGIGPRVCIGAQFALTEATLVLATLIQIVPHRARRRPPGHPPRHRHHPARPPPAIPAAPASLGIVAVSAAALSQHKPLPRRGQARSTAVAERRNMLVG